MTTIDSYLNSLPVLESDRRFEIDKIEDLTFEVAEDLIYRLGFTAKDIAIHTKNAPSTKEVSAYLKDLKIERLRLSKEDYDKAKIKHIERLKKDPTFDQEKVRERLLQGMTAPSEIHYEYNIPHRKIKEILVELIPDYLKIASKCSSMRAIARSNRKSEKFKIAEKNDLISRVLKEFSISFETSADYLRDLREKIEYDLDVQKLLLKRYCELLDDKISYPEDEIFKALEFRMPNKSYLELRDEKVLKFDNSVFYRPMSKHEEDVLRLIREYYDGEVLINDRKILSGKELDFYLPEMSLAIEVNPIFTHNSNLYRNNHNGWRHDDDYHFKKYLKCKESSVELIQLQEYDLDEDRFETFTRDLIKSKVSNRSRRVFARQTRFTEIETSEAKDFLNRYHRDGYAQSSRKFALFLEDEMIAVATVSKDRSRFNRKDGSYELVRLAFKSDLTLIGGLSKITKNLFKEVEDMDRLVTFSDNDYGSGSAYSSAGYEYVSETGPRLRYISCSDPANDRYSWMIAKGFNSSNDRTVVAKDALSKKLKVENVEKYIETELSHRTDGEKGYNRMFTSGSKKWKMERSDLF